jgi:glutamate formiminotransferase
MEDARAVARQVGEVLADDLGVPVYFYAEASDPPGRRLAELRRGGFEGLVAGWPAGRAPDLLPDRWPHPGVHPTAGATCIGARPLLLAWNVFMTGIELSVARSIAAAIRESGGGFPGLRALAFALPRQEALQISMNLEDLQATSPIAVFRRIEEEVEAAGGSITETEVIGMVPDGLVFPAAAERLRLPIEAGERLLSRQLVEYLAEERQQRGWSE